MEDQAYERHIETYIKDAVRLAHEDGERGHDAQVLVQGKDLLFKTEWTYGHVAIRTT
jgi:hypothetical protein